MGRGRDALTSGKRRWDRRTGLGLALAAAFALTACAQPGTTPEVQNSPEKELSIARKLEATLRERGLAPATAAEVVARRVGNTSVSPHGTTRFVSYYRPDGALAAQLTTLENKYLTQGTWFVRNDGIRCVAFDPLKGGNGGSRDGSYSGSWEKAYAQNCYRVYYEGEIEFRIRVSGPHHIGSAVARILPGNPFGL